MRVSEAKFTRRYNVAQYEHEEYSLTATVEDDENAIDILKQLKADVQAAKDGECPAGEPEDDESDTPEPSDDETGDDDTEADDSESDSDSEEETDDEESEDEDDDEASAPSKKSSKASSKTTKANSKTSSAKGGKKFKTKAQVYQRSNETHKELFSNTLKAVYPDWKKSAATKAKGKSASQKMEGKDFLDDNGNVLPAFKAELKKLVAKK